LLLLAELFIAHDFEFSIFKKPKNFRKRKVWIEVGVHEGEITLESCSQVREIKPAAQIVHDVVREAEQIIKELSGLV